MRRALLVIAFVLAPVIAEACSAGPGANTWTASDVADIKKCYDRRSFARGDTIKLTPSSYTVNSGITLGGSKPAKISIAGSTITDNTGTDGSLFTFTEPTVALSNGAGIWIDGGGTGSIVYGTNKNASFAMIKWFAATNGKPTLVTGISFPGFVNGQAMYTNSNRGVISGNTFTGVVFVPGCLNTGAIIRVRPAMGVSGFESPPKYGDDDTNGDHNIYVENNVIKNFIQGADIDNEARVHFRFNTIINSNIVQHGDTSDGGRYVTFWKNIFRMERKSDGNACPTGKDVNFQRFVSLRAGTARFIDNSLPTIVNDWTGPWIFEPTQFSVWNLRRNGGNFACWIGTGTTTSPQYPAPRQVGWGYKTGATVVGRSIPGFSPVHQDLEPVYFAGNTGSGATAGPAISTYGCNATDPNGRSCDNPFGTPNAVCESRKTSADFIQANREYYQQVSANPQSSPTSPFNGSSGTGYGTLANRPLTCTAGTAYFATDQGSWNTTTRMRGALIGTVPDDGSQTQGVLYICTATDTWTASVPLTFPHPIVTGTQPSPPRSNSGEFPAGSTSSAIPQER